jgi:hypothetical protein
MPSKVYFASAKVKRLSADDTLPAKFRRMLDKLDLKTMFADKRVAIKMHVGGHIGYTTVHPLFVNFLVDAVKKAGGRPFITDGSFSVPGATIRGYTEQTVGAPIYPVAGSEDRYYQTAGVGYRGLKEIEIAGNIADVPTMIVLSHAKGHGQCGFGGAIKNIAMGCVTERTRGWIHALMDTEFKWNSKACRRCRICAENCPGGAISFEGRDFHWFSHHCRYCMHCVDSCPVHAITIGLHGWRYFQEGMARVTKTILKTFKPKRVLYITMLMNITPLCDCWGFTTPSLVPDVGIMASQDIVAIEQAAIDSIKVENYIPGSLPDQVKMRGEGHLFERIWAKDPYVQVRTAAKLGLGSQKYQLTAIR